MCCNSNLELQRLTTPGTVDALEDWTADAEDLELDELPVVLRAFVGGGTAPSGVAPRIRKPGQCLVVFQLNVL